MDFEIVLGGNGFYYNSKHESLPTFIDLKDFIAKSAYCKWQQAKQPITDGFDFWLAAERELFGGFDNGYWIFVCNLSEDRNKGFYRFWEKVKVNE